MRVEQERLKFTQKIVKIKIYSINVLSYVNPFVFLHWENIFYYFISSTKRRSFHFLFLYFFISWFSLGKYYNSYLKFYSCLICFNLIRDVVYLEMSTEERERWRKCFLNIFHPLEMFKYCKKIYPLYLSFYL